MKSFKVFGDLEGLVLQAWAIADFDRENRLGSFLNSNFVLFRFQRDGGVDVGVAGGPERKPAPSAHPHIYRKFPLKAVDPDFDFRILTKNQPQADTACGWLVKWHLQSKIPQG